MKNKLNFWLALPTLLLVLIITGCGHQPSSISDESAEKALSTFKLPPGFKIELVAAEPLISDPVDMTIDEEGRMYVVEMHGYPLDLSNSGKIIMLRDTSGDGKMDTRIVFADSLVLPTGVMRWKKGIIVTDPPNVYYMEDTNGDGRADIKKVMLTGFALTNPQYLVNRPLYGLDNWIYLAHEGIEESATYKEFGDPGKDIFYPDAPDSARLPVNAQGRIVRFKPDVHALEETSSSTQFGQTFDDLGHHFLVYNANHIYQEVIANRYLKRNPDQIVGDATASLSDHGDACDVYPITKNPEHQLLTDVGVITSACGITAYQGGAFPDSFNHNLTFVCEPVSNLVHADRLKDNGATFTASRVFEHQEFLASTDAWFRPVNMYIGPDGALYVVDYYREIIEHPEWMSKSEIESGKLYNGRDKGRIYRISATDAAPADWVSHLNLNDSTDIQLVEKLSSPNIWWRRNAQRLLIDRNHETIVPALVQMAQNTQSSLGRLHALWTFEGMNKLTRDLVMQALHDPEPGIRENAIQLAELHLAEWPDLVPKLIALKEDNNAKVRYQLLCTLGSLNTSEASAARQELLFKDISDNWVQIAALSASSSQSSDMLEGVLKKFDPAVPAYASLVTRLGTMIGAGKDSKTIQSFLKRAVEPTPDSAMSWKAPLLEGLAEGLKNRKSIPEDLRSERKLLISVCLHHPDVNIRRNARIMLENIGIADSPLTPAVMQEAQKIAADKNMSSDKRTEAINLMALQNPKQDAEFLESLITPDASRNIQVAAIQALSKIPDTTVSIFLLKNWASLFPGVKDVALNTFITEPFSVPRISLLLQSISKGTITKAELGWPVTVILMRDIPDSLKEYARTLLSGKKEDRNPVVKEYEASLQLKGDASKGKTVYQTNCMVCHQVRGKIGIAFGPDLGTVQSWKPENIMINILDPNLAISHSYELWNIVLNDGTMLQGIIASETSSAIVVNQQGGVKTTIARNDIKSLRTLDVSAMPNDFEKRIDKQQMADLIAFIKQGE